MIEVLSFPEGLKTIRAQANGVFVFPWHPIEGLVHPNWKKNKHTQKKKKKNREEKDRIPFNIKMSDDIINYIKK